MGLTLYFNQPDAIKRLLEQPGDIRPQDKTAHIELKNAGAKHRELFDRYRGDVANLISVAAPWWEGTIKGFQERNGVDRPSAIKACFNNRAAGAAAHPNVVWIIRNYWLDCADLNKETPHEAVPPQVFLLQWLIDEGEKDGVDLVSSMPYWPIGFDGTDWC